MAKHRTQARANVKKKLATSRARVKARKPRAPRAPRAPSRSVLANPTQRRDIKRAPPVAQTPTTRTGRHSTRTVEGASTLGTNPSSIRREKERKQKILDASGPRVFRNQGTPEANSAFIQKFAREQRARFEAGEIGADQIPSTSQKTAALDRMDKGFSVDIFGFNRGEVLEQVGRTKFDAAQRPSAVAGARPDPAGKFPDTDRPTESVLSAQARTGGRPVDVAERALEESRLKFQEKSQSSEFKDEQRNLLFSQQFGLPDNLLKKFGIDMSADDPFSQIRGEGAGDLARSLHNDTPGIGEVDGVPVANAMIVAQKVIAARDKYDSVQGGTFLTDEDQSSMDSLRENLSDEEKTLSEIGDTPSILGTDEDIQAGEDASLEASASEQMVTPQAAGGSAALANLAKSSPEAQALMPVLAQFQADLAQQAQANREFVEQQTGQTRATFDSVGQQIADMQQSYRESSESISDFLKEAKEDSDMQIGLEEAAAKGKLKWAEAEERATIVKNKANAHDALIIQMALEGGFGQPAALRGVMATDNAFDEALTSLGAQFAFKRSDLAAKYSGLYSENKQNYIKETVANYKEMQSAIERLTTLGIQNEAAEQNAINAIVNAGFARQDGYATASSKATMDIASTMLGIISDDKNRASSLADKAQAKLEKLSLNAEKREDKLYDKSTADYLKQQTRLTNAIQNDDVLKAYRKQKTKFETIDADYNRSMEEYALYKSGEIDQITMNFTDQGLVNGINKMWDESSVVRESEYDRTPNGGSFLESKKAWFGRQLKGGILSDFERTAIKQSMDTMFGVWEAAGEESLKKFYNQMNNTNSVLHDDHQFIPEDFGMPPMTTGQSDIPTYNMDWLTETLFGEAPPITSNIQASDMVSMTVGGKKVKGQPYFVSSLQKADAEMFAATGEHIQVAESYRTPERQAQLFADSQAGLIGRAAPADKSFHPKGLSADIINHQAAKKYLLKYGIVNELGAGDRGHFSILETNPDFFLNV